MSAPLVIVQFTTVNPRRIPNGVPPFVPETLDESKARRAANDARAASSTIVEKTRRCDASKIFDDLADAGYYLVSVFVQERRDKKNPRRVYYNLRYTYASGEEAAGKLDSIRKLYPTVEDDMLDLFCNAYFQTRAYWNLGADGKAMLSINLDYREPHHVLRYDRATNKDVLVLNPDLTKSQEEGDVLESELVEPEAHVRITEELIVLMLPHSMVSR